MTFDMSEIADALRDPMLNPSWVVMILDLPALGIKEWRSVSLDTAFQALLDLSTKIEVHGDPSSWRLQLNQQLANGMTPIVKLFADEKHSWLSVSGVQIPQP